MLKFVQAATEANCSKLDIAFADQKIRVWLRDGVLPSSLEFRDNLQGLSPDTVIEEHLLGGLLALHEMEGSVSVESGGHRWSPFSDGAAERVPLEGGMRVVYSPPRQGFWSRLRGRLAQTITALDELQTWCYACPSQITIDGQGLAESQAEIPLLVGLLQGAPSDGVLRLGGTFARAEVRKKSIFCHWASSNPPNLACAVRIDHRRKVPGKNVCLDWVRSGVVVRREATKVEGLSLLSRVVIPTTGLQFDASGFHFEETALVKRRRARAAYHLNDALLSLRGDLGRDSHWHNFLSQQHPDFGFATRDESRLVSQVNFQLEAFQTRD